MGSFEQLRQVWLDDYRLPIIFRFNDEEELALPLSWGGLRAAARAVLSEPSPSSRERDPGPEPTRAAEERGPPPPVTDAAADAASSDQAKRLPCRITGGMTLKLLRGMRLDNDPCASQSPET